MQYLSFFANTFLHTAYWPVRGTTTLSGITPLRIAADKCDNFFVAVTNYIRPEGIKKIDSCFLEGFAKGVYKDINDYISGFWRAARYECVLRQWQDSSRTLQSCITSGECFPNEKEGLSGKMSAIADLQPYLP